MFDIGMMELLVIGIVALIVVGPKDLPGMFRTLGRFVGKARAMAREFQRAMEAAADESGVKDMAREFRDAASGKDFGADALRDVAKGPKHWAKQAAKRAVTPPAKDEAAADAADAADAATRLAASSDAADPRPAAGATASGPAAASAPASAPASGPDGPAAGATPAAAPEEGLIRPEKP